MKVEIKHRVNIGGKESVTCIGNTVDHIMIEFIINLRVRGQVLTIHCISIICDSLYHCFV